MRRLTPDDVPDHDAVFAPLAEFGTVGLAVSGGPDSLGLMVLAAHHARARAGAPAFVVYTVDHGLRPEASEEAAFVVREAERLGLAARALRWSGRKPGTGLQAAARRARYRLIGEAMARDGARVLVTAHHLRDQAETVLMRLAHGSGIEGLRGMDYFATVEGVDVVRPLLGLDPTFLSEIVRAAGLTPVTDPSNADIDYERVRWRQMLPELARLGLTAERLATFATRAREDDRAIETMAAQAYPLVAIEGEPPAAAFERHLLRSVPFSVAVRIVGFALRRVGAGGRPGLAALEALTRRLVSEPLRTTLHGCIITSDGVAVAIRREPLTGARARRMTQPVT